MPDPFGYQLLVDCYDCQPPVYDSIDACHAFLLELVDVLGVKTQAPPFVFQTDAVRFPDKAGLSGWVPLVESGIQIHTITPKRFVSLDVYSCRHFESATVLTVVQRGLAPSTIHHVLLPRGEQFNEEVV